MPVPLLFIAAAAGFSTMLLAGIAKGANVEKKLGDCALKAQYIALARKWAVIRGLPVEWVLATICSESLGKEKSYISSSKEKSVGLMQINTLAHGDRLQKAGVTVQALYNPDKNIEWGTLILKEAYDTVKRVLKGKPHPTQIDLLTRLIYVGYPISNELLSGRDPVDEAYARLQASDLYATRDRDSRLLKTASNWRNYYSAARLVA